MVSHRVPASGAAACADPAPPARKTPAVAVAARKPITRLATLGELALGAEPVIDLQAFRIATLQIDLEGTMSDIIVRRRPGSRRHRVFGGGGRWLGQLKSACRLAG